MISIVHAESPPNLEQTRDLMLEYARWLEFDLCFQGFEEELRSLPGKYAAPRGRLLLALADSEVAGMCALRPLAEEGVCEMKRLYVRPQFRGKAIGRVLAAKIIAEADAIGYRRMRLDTVPGRMDGAIAMYRELGFREIESYYATPVRETLFMELDLTASAPATASVRRHPA
jgi:ribosomal protein S18 acetylase RimI-like enzyme